MIQSILQHLTGSIGERSLPGDLRNGRAGPWVRLAASLAAVPLCLVVPFIALGLIEHSGARIQDEHFIVAMGFAALCWCVCLAILWWTFRRKGQAIRSTLAVLGLWSLTTPIIALLIETRKTEFLAVSVILLSIAATFAIIISGAYRSVIRKDTPEAQLTIEVTCPTCGYSMVGLEKCQCPECGGSFTIDVLVASQHESLVSRLESIPTPAPALPAAELDPPAGAVHA